MASSRYVAGQGPVRTKPRIGIVTAILMVAVALMCDLFQAATSLLSSVEGVGFALLPLAWLASATTFSIFAVWFALLHVNYLDRNAAVRLFTIIVTFAAEFVPFFNVLPAITFGVVALINVTRYEDGKSGMFVRAKRRYLSMNADERAQAQHSAQVRFDRDQKSRVATQIRKRGGSSPSDRGDFESAEAELKARRIKRQQGLNEPAVEATFYDAEEEAMLRDVERRKNRRKDWF